MRSAFVVLAALCAAAAVAQPDARLRPSAGALPDAIDFSWTWEPAPRWLDGLGFSLQAFGGGLDLGERFFGSTVPGADVPPIEIVFDDALDTQAPTYDRSQGYALSGVGTFPGAAYDVSDPDAPRRLNMALTEDPRAQEADRRWNPSTASDGGREYLLVLSSTYDPAAAAAETRQVVSLDTYLGLAPRLVDGNTLDKVDPATLAVTPIPLRRMTLNVVGNGAVDVGWTAASYLDAAAVRVYGSTSGTSPALVAEVAPDADDVRIDGLDRALRYTVRIDLIDGDGAVIASQTASATPSLSRGVTGAASLAPKGVGPLQYADVWGYTAPGGREYALLAVQPRGTDPGLSVIDITDAPGAAPVEVGFVPTTAGANDSKDVKVYGRYAYLANENGPLQIIDLFDPADPVQVGTLDVQPGTSGGGAHNVLVANDHLWVVGGRTDGTAGVRVFSLADPAAPAFVGAYHPPHQRVAYYHDFEVRGSVAYGSAIYQGGGVDVLDVSDPANIQLITTFTYPGAGAHNTCTTDDGQFVFVGDEIGSQGNWLRTFDLRDLDNIELVGEVIVNRDAVVHNCYVRGDLLYVAHYTEGLRVFNVSDPFDPEEVAFYDTYQGPSGGFSGAWSVYPYFSSGKVIVSDREAGLFVVTLDSAVSNAPPPVAAASPLVVAPNPVADRARLLYTLDAPGRVRLSVYDARGREVVVLRDDERAAGPHLAVFDAAGLPAGLYLVRLVVDGQTVSTRPATVVR